MKSSFSFRKKEFIVFFSMCKHSRPLDKARQKALNVGGCVSVLKKNQHRRERAERGGRMCAES